MIQDDETNMASAIQSKWPRVKHQIEEKKQKIAVRVTCFFCEQSHTQIFDQDDCPVYITGVNQASVNDVSKFVKHSEHCIVHTASKVVDAAIDDLFAHPPEDRPNAPASQTEKN